MIFATVPIKLTNPTLKNYSIVAKLEKNRIIIYGGIDYHHYSYAKLAKCTVSLIRNARSIAQDIKRKILINAVDEINKANDYHQKKQQDEEHRKIVKGMLTRLVKLTPYWNAMTGIKTLSGIDGTIRESYNGYVVQFDGLTTEQLIKLVGFISVL